MARCFGSPSAAGSRPEGQDFGTVGVTPNVEVEIPADAEAGFLVDRALSYIDSTA